MKTRHEFPRSTTGRYMPGVGITITRANIDAEQARRVKAGEEPATLKDIIAAFVHPGMILARKSGIKRHMARAYRLMSQKPVALATANS